MKYIYTVFIILTSFNLISQVKIAYGKAGDEEYLKPYKASFVDSKVDFIIDDSETMVYCNFSNPIMNPFEDMYWRIEASETNEFFDIYRVTSQSGKELFLYFYRDQHGVLLLDKSTDNFTSIIGEDLSYKIKIKS